MLGYISARAEPALLFAAPKPYANSATGFYPERLKYSHSFEGSAGPCRIIGRPRPRVPRIHAAAKHHYPIFQVAARNFRDDVVTHQILIVEAAIDVKLQFNRDAFGQKAY